VDEDIVVEDSGSNGNFIDQVQCYIACSAHGFVHDMLVYEGCILIAV
jgi:hypothetical protein